MKTEDTGESGERRQESRKRRERKGKLTRGKLRRKSTGGQTKHSCQNAAAGVSRFQQIKRSGRGRFKALHKGWEDGS